MTFMSEDLKRDLQEAAQREKRIRIKIAISLIIIFTSFNQKPRLDRSSVNSKFCFESNFCPLMNRANEVGE